MQDLLLTNAPSSEEKRNRNLGEVLYSYYQLTKPRIIVLLLITTAGAMWIAASGQVDPILLLVTILGGAFAAASANTINCLYDRDIDYIMERTRLRPIPSGKVSPRDALLFAAALACLSFGLLYSLCQFASSTAGNVGDCHLCGGIYDLVEAIEYTKYCDWWGSRSNSAAGWLGSRHGRSQLGSLGLVCNYFYLDSATLLGAGIDDPR
jgi:hypothetical protein